MGIFYPSLPDGSCNQTVDMVWRQNMEREGYRRWKLRMCGSMLAWCTLHGVTAAIAVKLVGVLGARVS